MSEPAAGPPRTGALLINLGTPDSPRPRDVRRYLREFLSDRRVIDLPAPLRALLVYGVILPFRTRRSAHAYRQIWTPDGSPLRVNGEALLRGVRQALGSDFAVELAMRYGSPSIAEGLTRLRSAGARELVVLPLFPQSAAATTGSALARVYEQLASDWDTPPVTCLGPCFDQPGFLESVAEAVRPELEAAQPDFVLMSFHGLPERHVRRSDPTGNLCLTAADCCERIGIPNPGCYRAQCSASARGIARVLELEADQWQISFQSRLGRAAWIGPSTLEVMEQLAARGVKKLAVLCPAFVADCLETLEEIGIRARAHWRERGGENFTLLPCPNAHPRWIGAVAQRIRCRS